MKVGLTIQFFQFSNHTQNFYSSLLENPRANCCVALLSKYLVQCLSITSKVRVVTGLSGLLGLQGLLGVLGLIELLLEY